LNISCETVQIWAGTQYLPFDFAHDCSSVAE
jgi:hypothetical protein